MFTTGMAVKAARERRGWSQVQLAERAGMNSSTLSRIESGATPNPGKETLRQIAQALGVSIEQLAGGQLAPPPIPLVGRVTRAENIDLPVYRSHAGRLILANSQPFDYWQLKANKIYTVEVIGDCLFGENINEGDRLIVDTEGRPENGKIVVVRIGDETYLTRWKRQHNGMVELEMSDGQLRDALVHDLDVQGVVVNVIKPAP